MKLELYSGGAIGADFEWEKSSKKYNSKISNFYICSFSEHNYKSCGFGKILTIPKEQLESVNSYILESSQILNRNIEDLSEYSTNLIKRNFFQVLKSEELFAVAQFSKCGKFVKGGTGYTVEFAKMLNLKIYVYDDKNWNIWNGENFEILEESPKITKNSTLVGTRKITNIGISEINSICLNSFTD